MSPNDILFYSQIGTLSINHKRGFLQQQTEVHTHTHRQTSCGERVQIAGVPQLLPPIAQGSPWKRRGDIAGVRRDGGHVQNMMRTNQVSRAHMGTQRLKRRVWGVHRSAPGPLCMLLQLAWCFGGSRCISDSYACS